MRAINTALAVSGFSALLPSAPSFLDVATSKLIDSGRYVVLKREEETHLQKMGTLPPHVWTCVLSMCSLRVLSHLSQVCSALSGICRRLLGGTVTTITDSSFGAIMGIAVDKTGALYVADYSENKILRVYAGKITTLAGTGQDSKKDGKAEYASFTNPSSLTVDRDGVVYVLERGNTIRKISKGNVSTLCTYNSGTADGPLSQARFRGPVQIVSTNFDHSLLLLDCVSGNIRKIQENGYVSTVDCGKNRIHDPMRLAADEETGTLYVADWRGKCVRKISPNGVLSTVAKIERHPFYIAFDKSDGSIYVAFRNTIRKISKDGKEENVYASAATAQNGKDGNVHVAGIGSIRAMTIHDHKLYFAEPRRIRMLQLT